MNIKDLASLEFGLHQQKTGTLKINDLLISIVTNDVAEPETVSVSTLVDLTAVAQSRARENVNKQGTMC